MRVLSLCSELSLTDSRAPAPSVRLQWTAKWTAEKMNEYPSLRALVILAKTLIGKGRVRSPYLADSSGALLMWESLLYFATRDDALGPMECKESRDLALTLICPRLPLTPAGAWGTRQWVALAGTQSQTCASATSKRRAAPTTSRVEAGASLCRKSLANLCGWT